MSLGGVTHRLCEKWVIKYLGIFVNPDIDTKSEGLAFKSLFFKIYLLLVRKIKEFLSYSSCSSLEFQVIRLYCVHNSLYPHNIYDPFKIIHKADEAKFSLNLS